MGHHTLRPLSDLVSIIVRTVSYRMAFPTFLLVSVFVATCQGTKQKPRRWWCRQMMEWLIHCLHSTVYNSDTQECCSCSPTVNITSALNNGGWVPKTFRSFYLWQPAYRLRSLPWLANPGNLEISPHTKGKKTGTHPTDKTVRERERGGRQPWAPTVKEQCTLVQVHTESRHISISTCHWLQESD